MGSRRLNADEIANALARARKGEVEMPLLMLRTSIGDSMSDVMVTLLTEIQSLRRHYDAAGPEHNLLALLDLYDERTRNAEHERDEWKRRAVAHGCNHAYPVDTQRTRD